MSDLDVSTQLETAPGTFLELEDEASGYTLGANAFADRTKSFKQLTVGEDVPWLRGEIVRASAPSNVAETLEVWVSGPDHYTFDYRVKVIEFAVCEQLVYRLVRRIANSKMTFTCRTVSAFRVQTQREYLWATTGLVTATIPTSPDVLLEEITGP